MYTYLLALFLFVGAPSSEGVHHLPISVESYKPPINKQRSQVIKHAKKYIGTPYLYGGQSSRGFDCSGLINTVFKKEVKRKLPRSSKDFKQFGKKISRKKAKPGDIVLFKKNGRIFHIALIESIDSREIKVVHSTSSKGVISQNISHSDYWSSKIEGFYQILGN